MLFKLPFKSFTCCIDNLPHIFHNLKIFFSQGRVFLSVQLTLSLWEILTMSTLRERSLTECFLQKQAQKLVQVDALETLCNTL